MSADLPSYDSERFVWVGMLTEDPQRRYRLIQIRRCLWLGRHREERPGERGV